VSSHATIASYVPPRALGHGSSSPEMEGTVRHGAVTIMGAGPVPPKETRTPEAANCPGRRPDRGPGSSRPNCRCTLL
jgi:hypothetical protein